MPKKGIGIAFWIDGVPGSADIVKVEVPSAIAAGISRRGMEANRNSVFAIGASTKRFFRAGFLAKYSEQSTAAAEPSLVGQH